MRIKGFKDTIEWYDQNAEEYSRKVYETVPLDSIKKFISYLPSNPFVLESGCGPGRESKAFSEMGVKTLGVDFSQGLLDVARQRNPNVEYIHANFLELPFDDSTFDGVWAHASLVHLDTIEEVGKALSEFHRVLKGGGWVYISVKEQLGKEKVAVVSDTLSKHERFFRYYTPQELVDLLEGSGFKIVYTGRPADLHGRNEIRWIEVMGRAL